MRQSRKGAHEQSFARSMSHSLVTHQLWHTIVTSLLHAFRHTPAPNSSHQAQPASEGPLLVSKWGLRVGVVKAAQCHRRVVLTVSTRTSELKEGTPQVPEFRSINISVQKRGHKHWCSEGMSQTTVFRRNATSISIRKERHKHQRSERMLKTSAFERNVTSIIVYKECQSINIQNECYKHKHSEGMSQVS